MWVVGLITFVLGLAAGYALHYFRNPDHDRNKVLEAELEALRQESNRYRDQVTQHFQRTSELVQDMTQSYRAVYEHLASSSQQLCGNRVSNPRLDLPERGRLPGTSRAEDQEATPPPSSRPQAPPVPGPATQDDHEEPHGDVPHVPDPKLHTSAAAPETGTPEPPAEHPPRPPAA
jgi:uncharacterized membrane-anchored protein YhcB (DUF1043 family)